MTYTLKEHQEKKKFPVELEEHVGLKAKVNPDAVKILTESAKGKSNRKLIVKMEAIHTGRTKNFTYYTEEGLKAGLKSWTQPYNKPVLTHHNENGEPIGRILNAEYSEQTLSGKPGLVFTVEITDPDAIEKVLDGRYQTVSIGASTDKVTCNICGTDRTQEWCDHFPGEKYDEQTCHFIIGTTYGREVSYVNTPADENAGNRSVEVVEESNTPEQTNESAYLEMYQMAEGLYQNVQQPEINLYEHFNQEVKELFNSMLKAKTNERSEKKVNEETTTTPSVEEQQKTDEDSNQVQESASDDGQVQESNSSQESNPVNTEESLTTLNEYKEKVSALEKRVSEMQKTITDMVLERSKLESELSEMKEENNSLVKENAKLVAENHKALAEKVVDLKRSLQKSDVIGISREEAIENHLKRTRESLQDSLVDLQTESQNYRPQPNSVQNPGISDNDDELEESYTLQDGINLLTNMFSGKKSRK